MRQALELRLSSLQQGWAQYLDAADEALASVDLSAQVKPPVLTQTLTRTRTRTRTRTPTPTPTPTPPQVSGRLLIINRGKTNRTQLAAMSAKHPRLLLCAPHVT